MTDIKTPMQEIIEKSHELMGHNNPDGARSFDQWFVDNEDRLLELETKLINQYKPKEIDRTVYNKREIVIRVSEDNISEYVSVLKKFSQDIHKENAMTKIRFDERYQMMARFLKYDDHSKTWFVGIYEAKRTKALDWTPQDLEKWLKQNKDEKNTF